MTSSAPRFELIEGKLIGLSEAGRKWLIDVVQEACDGLGVTFSHHIHNKLSLRGRDMKLERIMFHIKVGADVSLSVWAQPNGDNLGTIFMTSSPYKFDADLVTTPREKVVEKLMCGIVETEPKHFLERIKASFRV